MRNWAVTVKGFNTFSLTNVYKAVKIEDAIAEAIKFALTLTREHIVQIVAREDV